MQVWNDNSKNDKRNEFRVAFVMGKVITEREVDMFEEYLWPR
jgi:hypothetical protein